MSTRCFKPEGSSSGRRTIGFEICRRRKN